MLLFFSSKKSKVDLKTGGVRAAYKAAPTNRQRPPVKTKPAPAAIPAPPARIQAEHGGAEAEDDGEGDAEHMQMSKAVAQPKVVSKASKVRLCFLPTISLIFSPMYCTVEHNLLLILHSLLQR